MKCISVILCSITLSSVAYAQVYKRTQPRLPEPTKEITKDSKTGANLSHNYNLFFDRSLGILLCKLQQVLEWS